MKTLDDYLTDQFKEGVTFHHAEANLSKSGVTLFKIHAGRESEALEFAVIANSLVAKEHINES